MNICRVREKESNEGVEKRERVVKRKNENV